MQASLQSLHLWLIFIYGLSIFMAYFYLFLLTETSILNRTTLHQIKNHLTFHEIMEVKWVKWPSQRGGRVRGPSITLPVPYDSDGDVSDGRRHPNFLKQTMQFKIKLFCISSGFLSMCHEFCNLSCQLSN